VIFLKPSEIRKWLFLAILLQMVSDIFLIKIGVQKVNVGITCWN